MSNAEVFQEVEHWSPDERRKLARHLSILEIIDDPAQKAALSGGIGEIKRGGGVTREELLAHLRERGIAPE